MTNIFHIAEAKDWADAQIAGDYRISTRGLKLDEVGFIHASTSAQVSPVFDTYYSDAGEVVVLVIDPELLEPELRFEHVPGPDQEFPHIYGPLNLDAVVEVLPVEEALRRLEE